MVLSQVITDHNGKCPSDLKHIYKDVSDHIILKNAYVFLFHCIKDQE